MMRPYIFILFYYLVLATLIAIMLTACASPPPVIQGSCHVPQGLDYTAQGPLPLPAIDTPLRQHLQDEARERSAHRTLANDYNALRDHVKGCQ